MTILDISVKNSVFLVTNSNSFFHGWLDGWSEVTQQKLLIFGEIFKLLQFFWGETQVQFPLNWSELGPEIFLNFW